VLCDVLNAHTPSMLWLCSGLCWARIYMYPVRSCLWVIWEGGVETVVMNAAEESAERTDEGMCGRHASSKAVAFPFAYVPSVNLCLVCVCVCRVARPGRRLRWLSPCSVELWTNHWSLFS